MKYKTECAGFHPRNKCVNQTPGVDFFWGFFVKDTAINSTTNVDILKKHEIRFFLIKLKIFYIWALNFPHVYISMLC